MYLLSLSHISSTFGTICNFVQFLLDFIVQFYHVMLLFINVNFSDEAVRYLRHLEARVSQLVMENDRLVQQQVQTERTVAIKNMPDNYNRAIQ